MNYICENCGKEHDGSYGKSKRFCSSHCAHSWASRTGNRRAIENGTFISNLAKSKSKSYRPPKEGGWTCRFCNSIFKTRKLLNEHKHLEHKVELSTNAKFGWAKGLTKETSKSLAKLSKTFKERLKEGKIIPSWTGKHHSEETKKKLRESTISFIRKTKNFTNPRFNPNSCTYIDKLNESKDWHLQHAKNGGEKYIDGFWLDGYDKDLNIAFEYDEPTHYEDVEANLLKDRDIQRMKYIHEKLNCRFFRYNEKKDLLYEVDFSIM